MVQPTCDALYSIAEFLSPDPVKFCRLASVNRTFYQVFTSDLVWRQLNPYGVQTGIYESFRIAAGSRAHEFNLVAYFWLCDNCFRVRAPIVQKITSNRFAWLGYLLQGDITASLSTPSKCIEQNLLSFRDFPEVIRCVLGIDGMRYQLCPLEIRNSYEYTMLAAETYPQLVYSMPQKFILDRQLALMVVSRSPQPLLGMLPDLLRDDEEIVRKSIACSPMSLIYASVRLQEILFSDRALTLKIAADPDAMGTLLFLPQFKDDYEVVMTTAKAVPEPLLSLVSERLQDDRSIVWAAVNSLALNLQFASKRLKSDKALVTMALENWPKEPFTVDDLVGESLLDSVEINEKIASLPGQCSILSQIKPTFRAMRHIVEVAVCNDGTALFDASEALQRDKALILRAVAQSPLQVYPRLPLELQNDSEILEAALHSDSTCLQFMDPPRLTRPLILSAMKSNGMALEHATQFWDDEEIVTAAVDQDPVSYRYASDRLKRHSKIAIKACKLTFNSCCFDIPHELLDDYEFVYPIVKRQGTHLQVLLQDPRLAQISVVVAPSTYQNIPSALKLSLEFNLSVVSENGKLFTFLPEHMQLNPEIQSRIGPIVS